MLSERRLRDWVALLDFEVDERVRIPRAHPDEPPSAQGARRSSEESEYRPRAALTAGAYLLKARKRVQTLDLGAAETRARQRVLVPAAEPTTKVGP